ncbi:Utp18p Ecym_6275 [Eremothecium cymbalariae DBVPG|uniref:Anaphase-promoting complex subunit 4 WD40 domain-containing protein n=1 Tax=Eremothecium cymbalariae (strain CBS 270.75 / DBVPG 7215 / KCTC 17166 / NRRL Y-17582) TaxID=931890 RepID=G8JVH7_ERECY|nr:hypothetical protein Ecym_6275 [Eremothecium cymbalariae DBVPG\
MDSTEPTPIGSPDEEELLLSKLVFGDKSEFYDGLHDANLENSSSGEDFVFQSDSEEDQGSSDAAGMDLVNDDQLYFVDEGGDASGEVERDADEMAVEEKVGESCGNDSESGDVWSDSDDERLVIDINQTKRTKKLRKTYLDKEINSKQYVQRLRLQFEKIYPRPQWAEYEDDPSDANSEDDDDEGQQLASGNIDALNNVLQSTYTYKDTSNRLLPPKTLDITRLKDANVSHPSKSSIQSLSFHPTKPLLLTGGYDRSLRIYHIDGKSNNIVSSVYLKGTPVQTCKFYASPDLNQQMILTAGRRRYMHCWDLSNTRNQTVRINKISRMYGHEETQRSFEKFKVAHLHTTQNGTHGIILLQGNNGWINVLHATTGIWMMGCKIEGVLVDFCIDYQTQSQDKFNTILIATNTYGDIWEFDLTNGGKVICKWKDEGAVGITTIQVGGGTNSSNILPYKKIRQNKWLAIGSESGFVNIYNRYSTSYKPIATLSHLTTTISSLEFSPNGEMLTIASRATKDAFRIVHLPSGTVFSNWPTSGTPLGRVTSVAFSPRGEMLAVGNEQGKVRLWRLNHY